MNLRPSACILITALVAFAAKTPAATHLVSVDDSGFAPASLTIETGDEVVWVNFDDVFPHTTTSDLPVLNPNYWRGIMVDQSDEFSKTFTTPGTFNYFDEVSNGTGSITVSTPAPAGITLETPRVEAGQFLFDVTGLTTGKSHVLQTSTNLTSWTSLSTNIATSSTVTFTNSAPTGTRFFQVYEIP